MELRTEEKMRADFNKRILEWKQGESRDGYVSGGEEIVEYKGFRYIIKVLRYYSLNEGFKPIHHSRTCEYHAVVEYPEDMEEMVRLVKGLESWGSDFLYHDTLHSFNDLMSLQEQIDCCHKWAKQDIDGLPEKINSKLKELEELKEKLKSIGGM
jgi:hypothetical protein